MERNIQERTPKKLLTPASGYLKGYSHTLNPYVGCAFGCSYCYVRRMPVALFRKEEWGTWVDIKRSAKESFKRELKNAKRKDPLTIFMSSSTDPYQPIEHREKITQALLETMAEEPPDFLFVQTRSPLVTRDIELFRALGKRVLISMTVETDRDDIRKAFSLAAPPIPARLKAMDTMKNAGLAVQAAVSPVLPSTEDFAKTLADHVSRVVVDDFFMGDGTGGKRTKQLGIHKLFKELDVEEWYNDKAYMKVVEDLEAYFPPDKLFISQEGFLPG
ncbi:DNA repair photolyase [Scopulibacillus darangshiensis]|uniref:DNA repair photolyase n=1 Tax=Scopulibacillus darangshiensis TaxID=442528 RepID=A0A4R2NQZ5_9BACL|nr:DNA repair photolyase [Scopulibacillus darangshiensis]